MELVMGFLFKRRLVERSGGDAVVVGLTLDGSQWAWQNGT